MCFFFSVCVLLFSPSNWVYLVISSFFRELFFLLFSRIEIVPRMQHQSHHQVSRASCFKSHSCQYFSPSLLWYESYSSRPFPFEFACPCFFNHIVGCPGQISWDYLWFYHLLWNRHQISHQNCIFFPSTFTEPGCSRLPLILLQKMLSWQPDYCSASAFGVAAPRSENANRTSRIQVQQLLAQSCLMRTSHWNTAWKYFPLPLHLSTAWLPAEVKPQPQTCNTGAGNTISRIRLCKLHSGNCWKGPAVLLTPCFFSGMSSTKPFPNPPRQRWSQRVWDAHTATQWWVLCMLWTLINPLPVSLICIMLHAKCMSNNSNEAQNWK